jgi:hypothetical protein
MRRVNSSAKTLAYLKHGSVFVGEGLDSQTTVDIRRLHTYAPSKIELRQIIARLKKPQNGPRSATNHNPLGHVPDRRFEAWPDLPKNSKKN